MLFVCVGGYDRGECLITVESFDITSNTWSPLKPMLVARGRFAVAEVKGCLYACGGSNGQMDLCSAECYDPHTATWTLLPDMFIQRSYAGSFWYFSCMSVKSFLFIVGLSENIILTTATYSYSYKHFWYCKFVF